MGINVGVIVGETVGGNVGGEEGKRVGSVEGIVVGVEEETVGFQVGKGREGATLIVGAIEGDSVGRREGEAVNFRISGGQVPGGKGVDNDGSLIFWCQN